MSIQFDKVKKSNLPPDSELLFLETQKFMQLWLWVLLIVLFGTQFVWIGFAIYQQIFLNEPWGNNPMTDVELIFTALLEGFVIVLIMGLFLATRLETRVYMDGIYFIYFPFHKKYRKISWDQLDEVLGRKYRPLIEFGGWGIRWGHKKWAYTVSGNECIELRKGDYKILVGTKKLNEFLSALDRAQNLYVAESYINS